MRSPARPKAADWVYAWTNFPHAGGCRPPVSSPTHCPQCGRPLAPGGDCVSCRDSHTPVRMVRNSPARPRVVAPAPRRRRRARPFRGVFLLLVGLLIGLMLPRPWQSSGPAAPPAKEPSANRTATQAALPFPSVSPAQTPLPASRIVAADRPPQAPWAPLSRAPSSPPRQKAAPPAPKASPLQKKKPSQASRAASTAYVVKSGDTFGSIANRFYGRADLAGRLIAANPGINPRALPLGRTIQVPVLDRATTTAPAGR